MQEPSGENIKLSIIIPYYNTLELTTKLLIELEKQITSEVEVIVVDDYSHAVLPINFRPIWLKYIRLDKNSGTASKPRNIGLDHAKGDYITFIDSDDSVSHDYISKVLKAITYNTDIIFLSWDSKKNTTIMYIQPPRWNCAVWCRVYKRDIIGNIKFDENLRIAEDWKFNEQVKWKTKYCIKDIVYHYNYGRKGSILNGEN